MNVLNTKFEDYQAQYETILPSSIKENLKSLKTCIHRAVIVIDEALIAPELVLKTFQLSLGFFSLIPSMAPGLEEAKLFCKDAKNFSNVIKGLKPFDGFLDFNFSWKPIFSNISGMGLFLFSTLSLLERTKILNIYILKTHLVAVPIFGILPYAGLFSFSIIGQLSVAILYAIENRIALNKKQDYFKNKKINFWLEPLDLIKVTNRCAHYKIKFDVLKQEIESYKELIREGEEIQSKLNPIDENKRLYICQKTLDELNKTCEEKEKEQIKYEEKLKAWKNLEKNWVVIDSEKLKAFQQAKQEKWELKLNKIELEKRVNFFSIISSIISIGRQILVIVGVAAGYGIILLPLIANIGMDGAVGGFGMASFFMKRSIKKIEIFPVNLSDYIFKSSLTIGEN